MRRASHWSYQRHALLPSSQLHKRWANVLRGMVAGPGRWHGHFRNSITEITDSAKGGIGSAAARTSKAFSGQERER